MKPKDEGVAVDALTAWFASQKIGPFDAVPIMAKAMVVAVISLNCRSKQLQSTTNGVMAASRLVLEAYKGILEEGKKGRKGKPQ